MLALLLGSGVPAESPKWVEQDPPRTTRTIHPPSGDTPPQTIEPTERGDDLPPERPEIAFADLFAALDPTHPDARIGAIRTAAANGDTEQAAELYLSYRRSLARRHPLRDLIAEITDPVLAERSTTIVDRLFEDNVLMPFYPGWNEEPVTLDPFDWEQLDADDRATWGDAIRGYWWNDLGRRWIATGNPQYAETAISAALRLIEIYRSRDSIYPPETPTPYPVNWGQFPYNYAQWTPLNAGIRAQDTLPGLIAYTLDSPSMTADRHARLVASLVEHARFLMEYNTVGINWGDIEASGLAMAAMMLPEFAEADSWREEAERRAIASVEIAVYDDGGQYELSPHYHNVVARNYWLVATARRQLRPDLGPLTEVEEALEAMIDWSLRMQRPSATEPVLGDSVGTLPMRVGFYPDEWRDSSGLEWGRATFDRPDWDYFDGVPGAAQPDYDQWFPTSGYATFRSGWHPRAMYVGMDVGQLGRNHVHEDGLHISLESDGHAWLVDSGRGAYSAVTARQDYFTNSAGHNTARPLGRSQNRRTNIAFSQWPNPDGALSPRIEANRTWWAYGRGVYEDGYSPLPDEGNAPPNDGLPLALPDAEHRRAVFIERDARRVWVLDDMTNPEPVAWEVFWHIDALGLEDVTPAEPRSRRGSSSVSAWQLRAETPPVDPATGAECSLFAWFDGENSDASPTPAPTWMRGSNDPIQGWMQDEWAPPRPVWAAILQPAAATAARQFSLFQPLGCPNETPSVARYPDAASSLAARGDSTPPPAAWIVWDSWRSRSTLVLFNPARERVTVGELETDAELAALWLAGEETDAPLFGWMALDATFLAWRSQVLHESTEREVAEAGPSYSVVIR